MQFGVWAIRRGDQARAPPLDGGDPAARHPLPVPASCTTTASSASASATGSSARLFYTLTGFHGAHVFGGAVGLTILFAPRHQGQFSARNHVAVEAISIYWHFVDVVWIALFSILYFLR